MQPCYRLLAVGCGLCLSLVSGEFLPGLDASVLVQGSAAAVRGPIVDLKRELRESDFKAVRGHVVEIKRELPKSDSEAVRGHVVEIKRELPKSDSEAVRGHVVEIKRELPKSDSEAVGGRALELMRKLPKSDLKARGGFGERIRGSSSPELLPDEPLELESKGLKEEEMEYLVDNSELRHKGKGVLYRKSKNQSDTIAKDQFVAWGSKVQGIREGEDWVKVGERYLPVKVHGATVLVKTLPAEQKAPGAKSPEASPAIQLKSMDGSLIPANIMGRGLKPNTFNLLVIPRTGTLEPYELPNVPESALVRAQPLNLMRRSPVAQNSSLEVESEEEKRKEHLELQVQDFTGIPMALNFSKVLRLRTLMYLACEKASIILENCTDSARFIHNGRDLNADDLYKAAHLRSGDTVYMLKRKQPPR